MKHTGVVILFLCIFMITTVTASADIIAEFGIITADNVVLREKPDLSSRALTLLPKDTIVSVLTIPGELRSFTLPPEKPARGARTAYNRWDNTSVWHDVETGTMSGSVFGKYLLYKLSTGPDIRKDIDGDGTEERITLLWRAFGTSINESGPGRNYPDALGVPGIFAKGRWQYPCVPTLTAGKKADPSWSFDGFEGDVLFADLDGDGTEEIIFDRACSDDKNNFYRTALFFNFTEGGMRYAGRSVIFRYFSPFPEVMAGRKGFTITTRNGMMRVRAIEPAPAGKAPGGIMLVSITDRIQEFRMRDGRLVEKTTRNKIMATLLEPAQLSPHPFANPARAGKTMPKGSPIEVSGLAQRTDAEGKDIRQFLIRSGADKGYVLGHAVRFSDPAVEEARATWIFMEID